MGESCKTLGEHKKYTVIVGKHDRGEQWKEIGLQARIILKTFLKTQVVIL
jgi:GTPase Era involved in 16S rRNA processing